MRTSLDYTPSPGRLILQRLYKNQRDQRWEAERIHRDLWDDIAAFHFDDSTWVAEKREKAA